jgi:hypothetical protein
MSTSSERAKRGGRRFIAGLLAFFLLMPATAMAGSFFVWGRVYSAFPQTEGDEIPSNPLNSVSDTQIIGEGLVALTPRNLVKVQVQADDGTELGSFVVNHDGAYLVSFSDPGASTKSIRLAVDELATSKRMMTSEPQTVNEWPAENIRYLLVEEADGAVEIGRGREFAPTVSLPAKYTGIFTRVGKIEVAADVGSVTQHLIDTTTGLANVPPAVAADLHIPEYQDAPFGGNLYIFGALSQDLYGLSGIHYRIKVTDLDDASVRYMDSPLVKTLYTVDLTTGTVNAERKTLGPVTVGTLDNCYELTPLAIGANQFWSFPDLLALWPTGATNGQFKLELEIVGLAVPSDFAAIPGYTDLTLRLSNTPATGKILPFPTIGEPDTARVYLPSSPADHPSGDDLTATLLGSYPVDYGGTADPTCAILDLSGTSGDRYLAFKLSAYQADGFLRYWHLAYERNDKVGEILIGKRYDGATDSMVDYITPIRISSAQSAGDGFQDLFLYLEKDQLVPTGVTVASPGCAYRFVIRATTRTTDGYHYLRLHYGWDQVLHYLQR